MSKSSAGEILSFFIVFTVTDSVCGIIIYKFLPTMDRLGLAPLRTATPELSELIDIIPILIWLIPTVGGIFVLLDKIRRE